MNVSTEFCATASSAEELNTVLEIEPYRRLVSESSDISGNLFTNIDECQSIPVVAKPATIASASTGHHHSRKSIHRRTQSQSQFDVKRFTRVLNVGEVCEAGQESFLINASPSEDVLVLAAAGDKRQQTTEPARREGEGESGDARCTSGSGVSEMISWMQKQQVEHSKEQQTIVETIEQDFHFQNQSSMLSQFDHGSFNFGRKKKKNQNMEMSRQSQSGFEFLLHRRLLSNELIVEEEQDYSEQANNNKNNAYLGNPFNSKAQSNQYVPLLQSIPEQEISQQQVEQSQSNLVSQYKEMKKKMKNKTASLVDNFGNLEQYNHHSLESMEESQLKVNAHTSCRYSDEHRTSHLTKSMSSSQISANKIDSSTQFQILTSSLHSNRMKIKPNQPSSTDKLFQSQQPPRSSKLFAPHSHMPIPQLHSFPSQSSSTANILASAIASTTTSTATTTTTAKDLSHKRQPSLSEELDSNLKIIHASFNQFEQVRKNQHTNSMKSISSPSFLSDRESQSSFDLPLFSSSPAYPYAKQITQTKSKDTHSFNQSEQESTTKINRSMQDMHASALSSSQSSKSNISIPISSSYFLRRQLKTAIPSALPLTKETPAGITHSQQSVLLDTFKVHKIPETTNKNLAESNRQGKVNNDETCKIRELESDLSELQTRMNELEHVNSVLISKVKVLLEHKEQSISHEKNEITQNKEDTIQTSIPSSNLIRSNLGFLSQNKESLNSQSDLSWLHQRRVEKNNKSLQFEQSTPQKNPNKDNHCELQLIHGAANTGQKLEKQHSYPTLTTASSSDLAASPPPLNKQTYSILTSSEKEYNTNYMIPYDTMQFTLAEDANKVPRSHLKTNKRNLKSIDFSGFAAAAACQVQLQQEEQQKPKQRYPEKQESKSQLLHSFSQLLEKRNKQQEESDHLYQKVSIQGNQSTPDFRNLIQGTYAQKDQSNLKSKVTTLLQELQKIKSNTIASQENQKLDQQAGTQKPSLFSSWKPISQQYTSK